jgi:hypothetical protein
VSGRNDLTRSECTPNRTLSFEYVVDGATSLDVYARDASLNDDVSAERLSWVWDRTDPDTSVAVDAASRSVWVPALGVWGVSNSSVWLSVAANEPTSGFTVFVDGVQYGALLVGPRVLISNLPARGCAC